MIIAIEIKSSGEFFFLNSKLSLWYLMCVFFFGLAAIIFLALLLFC